MSNINVNARVRIGNGKVEYTVFAVTEKGFNLQDDKGRNRYDVPAEKLTVIEAAMTEGEEVSSLNDLITEISTDKARSIIADVAKGLTRGVFAIIDGVPTQYKSFDRAAFEVSRNHTYASAAIVVDGVVKAERTRA